MFVHGQRARQLEAVFFVIALLGTGIACSGPTTGPSPTPGPSATGPIIISPARLEASLSEPFRADGRYLINPSVTFSAAGTATMVKEVTFAFVVDADRVIKQGAFLVHGGDLRRGPVTQRYPLTFDVPVHFPNLRIQMRALFIDDSGAPATHVAEAAIQLPAARP